MLHVAKSNIIKVVVIKKEKTAILCKFSVKNEDELPVESVPECISALTCTHVHSDASTAKATRSSQT